MTTHACMQATSEKGFFAVTHHAVVQAEEGMLQTQTASPQSSQ